MTLSTQFFTLAAMIISGIVLGTALDTYRVVKGQFRIRRAFLPFFDLAYWILATIFVFLVLFYSNNGQIRLYIFLGLVIGGWIYFKKMSSLTIRFVLWLIKVIRYISILAVRLFKLTVIQPVILLYKVTVALIAPFGALGRWLFEQSGLKYVATFLTKIARRIRNWFH